MEKNVVFGKKGFRNRTAHQLFNGHGMKNNPERIYRILKLEIFQLITDIFHKTRAHQQNLRSVTDLVFFGLKRDVGLKFHVSVFSVQWQWAVLNAATANCYPIKSFAFFNASTIPSGLLPPAVAKNACPPPPPLMDFPSSRTICPAFNFLSSTKFFEM